MAKLEDLQTDAAVRGIRPDSVVTVVSTQWHGSDALTLVYGFRQYADLFTARQLVALTSLSDLVQEARQHVESDALAIGLPGRGNSLAKNGTGAAAYADAVAVYLALAIDKATDYNSSLVQWSPTRDQAKTTFSRQALQITWDFSEINMFAHAAGDVEISLAGISRTLAQFGSGIEGHVVATDSQTQSISLNKVISTDPPYYDNIGYADLSDFFYVWLRHSLKPTYPELFATLAVPKALR